MYRMTYNNKGITGCSARGIAKRKTIKELLDLAESLEESICNVEIKPVDLKNETILPISIDKPIKETK